jgi:hypothetical protein
MKQTDWQSVAAETKALFPNLVQIASYSRQRWILVFETEPDNFLSSLHPLSRLLQKHKLQVPLIVSVNFIKASLDCYPLEFLDIQSDYTSLYAVEDVLKDIRFDKEDVRLQIERELKSKWLLTRLEALDRSYRAPRLLQLLQESFTALLPVFKGMCYLEGVSIPKETGQLLDKLEDILHTDVKILRYILSRSKAPSLELMNNLFNDYIRFLHLCGEKADAWKPA